VVKKCKLVGEGIINSPRTLPEKERVKGYNILWGEGGQEKGGEKCLPRGGKEGNRFREAQKTGAEYHPKRWIVGKILIVEWGVSQEEKVLVVGCGNRRFRPWGTLQFDGAGYQRDKPQTGRGLEPGPPRRPEMTRHQFEKGPPDLEGSKRIGTGQPWAPVFWLLGR